MILSDHFPALSYSPSASPSPSLYREAPSLPLKLPVAVTVSVAVSTPPQNRFWRLRLGKKTVTATATER